MNVIGQRLREARLAQDPPWSLEDLSQALAQHEGAGLSPATLGKVERGERSAYDFEVAAFIQVLALDPGWLLGLPAAGKPGEGPGRQDLQSNHSDGG